MTRIISWDKKEEKQILLPSLKDIEKRHARLFEGFSSGVMTLANAEAFLLRSIEAFRSGELSSDELSVIGFEIFHGVAKHHLSSDLYDASLAASELGFYIRSPHVYKNVVMFLEDINRFYEKNNQKLPLVDNN